MQIQIQIEILYQKISQIEIQIHKKKVFENTFQIQILFKYTSLVQVNLYRARDSHALSLAQIRLLGYPIFEDMRAARPDMMLTPVEDLVSRSNMGWLRLLHMCLTSVPCVEQLVCQRIQVRVYSFGSNERRTCMLASLFLRASDTHNLVHHPYNNSWDTIKIRGPL